MAIIQDEQSDRISWRRDGGAFDLRFDDGIRERVCAGCCRVRG